MLHKASKVRGFHIHATDGPIGHVDDFLFDETCTFRYLLVDTSNWLGGKSVLVSTAAVTKVDSPKQEIYVNLTRGEIERGPSVNSAEIELVESLPSWIII